MRIRDWSADVCSSDLSCESRSVDRKYAPGPPGSGLKTKPKRLFQQPANGCSGAKTTQSPLGFAAGPRVQAARESQRARAAYLEMARPDQTERPKPERTCTTAPSCLVCCNTSGQTLRMPAPHVVHNRSTDKGRNTR